MTRYFLLPRVGTGTPEDPSRAKYLGELREEQAVTEYATRDMGPDGIFLSRVTANEKVLDAIGAHDDVLAFPIDLDARFSANQSPKLVAALEALKIPKEFIVEQGMYRELVASLSRYVTVHQRYHGLYGASLLMDETLDTKVEDLKGRKALQLVIVIDSLALEDTFLVRDQPMRQALKDVAERLPADTFVEAQT